MVRLNIVRSLVDLLSHENVDIAITVVEVLEELTDDDVAEADDDDAATAAAKALEALVSKFLEDGGLDFIVQHLSRLDEKEEPERLGVYHALGLLENLVSSHPPVAGLLIKDTGLLPWLLARTAVKPEAIELSAQNRQYAGELVAILLQSQDAGPIRIKFGELGGVDTCLTILAVRSVSSPAPAVFEQEHSATARGIPRTTRRSSTWRTSSTRCAPPSPSPRSSSSSSTAKASSS
jgi:beta-catenin-like protein 1